MLSILNMIVDGLLWCAAAAFALFVLFILFICIYGDWQLMKQYRNASRSKGTVIRQIENTSYGQYQRPVLRTRKVKYYQYEIEFIVDGQVCTGILQLKRKVAQKVGLRPGSTAMVRYIRDVDTGEVKVVHSGFRDRLMQFLIVLPFGLAYGLFLAVYTTHVENAMENPVEVILMACIFGIACAIPMIICQILDRREICERKGDL
ncbi:MAG: hypothetical protein ACLTKI_06175 [Lachnospiraceae bacterium]